MAGTTTSAASAGIAGTSPHRLSTPASPNIELRDAATNIVTDVITEPLGLRTVAVDPNLGFLLNGVNYDLHGVNRHQDRQDKGWAIRDENHVEDFDLMAEIGATAIRLAHYQHDQKAYELADELGFVIWAEIPLVDAVTNSAAFRANATAQLYELIRQNYNHPSIAFWGIGNEQRVNDAATNDLLDELAGVVSTEDPERISTYASCCLSDSSPVALHAQTTAYNKYYGWYYGVPSDIGGWADSMHAALPTRPLAVSEYGAGANVAQHALNPAKPTTDGDWHPEEYQALLHEQTWAQLKTRDFLWGTYVWNMFDFASDGRDEGAAPGRNDKGLVTYDRATKKDAFYFYKANWSSTPVLYLTSRRWTQRTAAATEVKVYSNASAVTVTVNGVSLGSRAGVNGVFRWTSVTLQPGANTVTATASINGQPYTDTVTWSLT
jgi:beta-galactosidase